MPNIHKADSETVKGVSQRHELSPCETTILF